MGMNAQIHLYLKSELLEKLKKEAEREGLSIATICREKLDKSNRLERMEIILETICKKLNISQEV